MDEKDIAPELLERIRADFLALLGDAQQELTPTLPLQPMPSW